MMLRRLLGPLLLVGVGLIACALIFASEGSAAQSPITRVSLSSLEAQALGGESENPAITSDGGLVAFSSSANNLVANDLNNQADIFVRDRQAGTTERISLDSSGDEADNGSYNPDFSSDGRFVAFESSATNLVANDTKGFEDIFVHDLQTGETERVSVDSAGNEADGGDSRYPSISGNGRYVAFVSYATNLAPNDSNDLADVFVHDRQTGVTERVSVSNTGQQATGANDNSESAEISDDGRFVAFDTNAPLVAGDTLGKTDVFVRDRQAHTTERISVSSNGDEANDASFYPGMTPDGRYVAFQSRANNLVSDDNNAMQDIFVRDRVLGTTERVSVKTGGAEITGTDGAYDQAISGDGRFILFDTRANGVVSGDNAGKADVFVHDRQTNTTEIESVNASNQRGDNDSYGSDFPNTLSADGRYLVLMSDAANLVPNDSNEHRDIFFRDRGAIATATPVSTPTPSPTPAPTIIHNTATPSPTVTATPSAAIVGDADCNGIIEANDVAALLSLVASLSSPCSADLGLGTPVQIPEDVDCDGSITALDALDVLLSLVELPEMPLPSSCNVVGQPIG
ncbi:MAG: calcium-binding protein [Chloroflexota bacterium]